jgi:hypothetical protein
VRLVRFRIAGDDEVWGYVVGVGVVRLPFLPENERPLVLGLPFLDGTVGVGDGLVDVHRSRIVACPLHAG